MYEDASRGYLVLSSSSSSSKGFKICKYIKLSNHLETFRVCSKDHLETSDRPEVSKWSLEHTLKVSR